MPHRNSFQSGRFNRLFISFAAAALAALLAAGCDSGGGNAPAKVDPLTLTAPKGGESYSFTDEIPFKWEVDTTQGISAAPINSYLREFSLDSGKTWTLITVKDGSSVMTGTKYQVTWIGLDTASYNNATGYNFTKADFLNRGVMLHVVSYPPNPKTATSGFVTFHD